MLIALISFAIGTALIAHSMAIAPNCDMYYNFTPAQNWYARLLRKLKLIK